MENDNLYVNAFVNNDNRLIKEFYKEVFPMMKSFVNSNFPILRDAEVKDIFQESIIALWTNIKEGRYQNRGNVKLSSYTIQIAKFKIMDKLKKKSFQMETEILPGMDKIDEKEIFHEEDQQVLQLRKIIKKMSERCRQLLTAFYFNEKKLDEVAQITGIGKSSIKNEKYRCMKKLRDFYKEQ